MRKEKLDLTAEELRDKYRGCLIGGAVGDALGYAVEFLGEEAIKKRYGDGGIREYKLVSGIAHISDDTQMTLFTANGLLLGKASAVAQTEMGEYHRYIALSYADWLRTQNEKYPLSGDTHSWLVNIPELFSPRAPGNTCLSALEELKAGGFSSLGSTDSPINRSKGCGGVMRVAPVGLYFGGKPVSIDEVDMLAAEVAAITHGHELGYIPAAALAHIIHLISHSGGVSLSDAVFDMMRAMQALFPNVLHIGDFIRLMEKAAELSQSDLSDIDAIGMLGEGWVAEETLAIAVFCSLRYQNDFEGAVIAAVNHNGDSDSTGAVVGNILGAYLGMRAIPQKYLDTLELRSVILELADDLYTDLPVTEDGIRGSTWEEKYIKKTYRPKRV